MTSVISNNQSSKYLRFTKFGCRYIGIRKFRFVAKKEENLFNYVLYSGKLGINCVYSAQGTADCNCGGEINNLSLLNGLNSKLNLNFLI